MNIVKSTGTFGFFTIISRLLGYLRDILIANMYIWGVSVGLDHNYFVIDYLTDLNPEFQKRVKGNTLLELPETIVWMASG